MTELRTVWVRPQARGRQVGSALVEAVVAVARARQLAMARAVAP